MAAVAYPWLVKASSSTGGSVSGGSEVALTALRPFQEAVRVIIGAGAAAVELTNRTGLRISADRRVLRFAAPRPAEMCGGDEEGCNAPFTVSHVVASRYSGRRELNISCPRDFCPGDGKLLFSPELGQPGPRLAATRGALATSLAELNGAREQLLGALDAQAEETAKAGGGSGGGSEAEAAAVASLRAALHEEVTSEGGAAHLGDLLAQVRGTLGALGPGTSAHSGYDPGLLTAFEERAAAAEDRQRAVDGAAAVAEGMQAGASSLLSPAGLPFFDTCTEFALDGTAACRTLANASQCALRTCAGGGAMCTCEPCPAGTFCPSGPRMWPQPGYWAVNERSGVRKCPKPELERCPGYGGIGLGGAGGPGAGGGGGFVDSCGAGYGGPFCSRCAAGYFKEGRMCLQCEDADATKSRYAGYIALGALAVCVALVVVLLVKVAARRRLAGAAPNVGQKAKDFAVWAVILLQTLTQVATAGSDLPAVVKRMTDLLKVSCMIVVGGVPLLLGGLLCVCLTLCASHHDSLAPCSVPVSACLLAPLFLSIDCAN